MRTDRQVAEGLTLTVTYVDRSHTTRTRSLAEATAHTPALAATARRNAALAGSVSGVADGAWVG
ncbi:DinB/UmuC family translesion DNA polymerase [Streptomyces exfoliatus]|uniref:DinB/UmuC family translesion DNA polymerase n=1 Tax=Streptomyces exfoliatus TaxID=1905 RepID=UPI00379B6AA2